MKPTLDFPRFYHLPIIGQSWRPPRAWCLDSSLNDAGGHNLIAHQMVGDYGEPKSKLCPSIDSVVEKVAATETDTGQTFYSPLDNTTNHNPSFAFCKSPNPSFTSLAITLTTLSSSVDATYPRVTDALDINACGRSALLGNGDSYICRVASLTSRPRKWRAARRNGGNLLFMDVGALSMVSGCSSALSFATPSIFFPSCGNSVFLPVPRSRSSSVSCRAASFLSLSFGPCCRTGTLSVCKRSIIASVRSSMYVNAASGYVLTQSPSKEIADVLSVVGISRVRTSLKSGGIKMSTNQPVSTNCSKEI